MPHELRDWAVARRYVEESLEQNPMMSRSLARGRRSNFAVIVDDPADVKGLMLVERTDWKGSSPGLTRIQLDALDLPAAIHLLSWLSPAGRVQLFTYRAWLHELAQSMFESTQVVQKVHCVADRHQFQPSPLHEMVREIGPTEVGLHRQAEEMGAPQGSGRLFGIVEGERLLAFATLAEPESQFVAVESLFTQESERLHGYGSAVLSAATAAGLQAGRVVTYGLPVADVPSLHLVAGLGFAPVCREWMVAGRPRG